MKIKPIHFEGLNCLEDQIISIVSSTGKTNYPLIYSESWIFNFDTKPKKPDDEKIKKEENNTYEFGNSLELLEKYCGVKTLKYYYKPDENPIDKISECLKEDIPVVINIDSFWCPWDDNYKKIHHTHFCIIDMINFNNKEFICTDAWYQKGNYILPFDHFINGSNFLIKFYFTNQNNDNFDYKILVVDYLNKLIKGDEIDDNIFQNMRTFAKYLSNNPKFVEELKNTPILWQSSIFFKFQEMQKGRAKYTKFLEYISEKLGINFSKEISQLISASVKWSTVKTLLTKAVFLDDYSETIKKLYLMIEEIADFEESIVVSILDKIEGKSEESMIYYQRLDYSTNINESDVKKTDILFLNLTKFLNNKGIDINESIESIADLTGNGKYILADDKLKSGLNYINNMYFNFPQIGKNKFDNMVCSNQIIDVPSNIINNSIFILGCTVWDDMLFNLELNYNNEFKLNLEIGISQWIISPIYGELVFWEGKGIEIIENQTKIINKPVRLFAKKYDLPLDVPLESIKLPDCPNIHIFAITLGKKIT